MEKSPKDFFRAKADAGEGVLDPRGAKGARVGHDCEVWGGREILSSAYCSRSRSSGEGWEYLTTPGRPRSLGWKGSPLLRPTSRPNLLRAGAGFGPLTFS